MVTAALRRMVAGARDPVRRRRGADGVLAGWHAALVARFALLASFGVVAGRSVAFCAVAGAAGAAATALGHRRWGGVVAARQLHARLALETAAVTLVTYATGWGALVPFGYVLAAARNIKISGSAAAAPAFAWMVGSLGAGQIAVAVGVFHPVVAGASGHALAGLAAVGLALVVGLLRTATAEKESAERDLVHRANHDTLTGLPNRSELLTRLDGAVARARRHGRTAAVLFCDLDGFKVVNDTRGHDVGDALLLGVAVRLRACVRTEETIARVGGDEFAIVLEDVAGAVDAERVAERAVEALRHPFVIDGATVHVGTSVGIAITSGGEDVEELLRRADVAMYLAKGTGGAGYAVFDETTAARLDALRSGSGPITVLLADDTEALRTLLRRQLELDHRFEVVGEAVDGAQAIERVRDLDPDVVLLDVAMPVMDGLQALPRIRRASPRTKIVMLSGFAAAQVADEALAAGAHAYVEKGTSIDDIAAVMARLCPRDVTVTLPIDLRPAADHVGGIVDTAVGRLLDLVVEPRTGSTRTLIDALAIHDIVAEVAARAVEIDDGRASTDGDVTNRRHSA